MIRIQPDEGYVGNPEETRSQSGDEMDYQNHMELSQLPQPMQLNSVQRLLSKAVVGLSIEERKGESSSRLASVTNRS